MHNRQRHSQSLPSLNIPEAKKDAQWHKDYCLGIIRSAVGNKYEYSYTSMQEAYDFYDGTQSNEEFDFIQTSETGDTLPAIWINYNKIRTKVDVLIGELSSKGYEIGVKAVNKEAVSKRLNKKMEMLGRMDIREDLQELEQISGFPSPSTENIPDTAEEIEEYINDTYKDEAEEVMEAALKFLLKKYKWDMKRLQLFKDVLITGRAFVKTKVVNGFPTYVRVDPRRMVIDTSATDDYLTDKAYCAESEYISLAEAVDIYKLTDDEIEEVLNSEENNSNVDLESEARLDYTSGDGLGLKVLVFHAEWQDYKWLNRKVSKDRFGNEHYKKVKDTAKGNDIIRKRVKVWRKCTLIGGKVVREFGIRENMNRSVDDIYDTNSSYVCFCHNFSNQITVSKVDMMKGIQKAKNIALYNLQLALNRAGTKGIAYDIANIPDEWDIEEVLGHLKSYGIVVYNSMKDGIPSGSKPWDEFDMTISNSIGQYINISNMYDRELDEITGINDARQGQVGSASQAVGVTQAAISASQFATEPLFEGFRVFGEMVFNELAGLVKIVYGEKKEIFAPIIGDAGVDFLKRDVDLHLNDYGAFVEMTPPLIVDKQKFENFINVSLQSGKIEVVDALDLIMEKDTRQGVKRLKRAIEKREKEKQQAEQAMQQAQQQAKAQAQQEQIQMQQMYHQQEQQAKALRRREEIQQTHQNRLGQEAFKAELRSKQV